MSKIETKLPENYLECPNCQHAKQAAERVIENFSRKEVEIIKIQVLCQPSDYSRYYRCPDVEITYEQDNEEKKIYIPEQEHYKCPGIEIS